MGCHRGETFNLSDNYGRVNLDVHLAVGNNDPVLLAEQHETGEHVRELLHALSPREEEVLALRYGIGEHVPLSLNACAFALDLEPVEVRALETKALIHLRELRGHLIGYL